MNRNVPASIGNWALVSILGAALSSCTSLPAASGSPALKPGDIVFRSTSRQAVSDSIYNRKEDRFRHAGVIVATGSDPRVVHVHPAENGGKAGTDSLRRFVRNDADWAVYRVNAPADRRAAIAEAANGHVASGTPFDRSFSGQDGTRQCTTLVADCVKSGTGIDLSRHTVHAAGFAFLPLDSVYRDPALSLVYDDRETLRGRLR